MTSGVFVVPRLARAFAHLRCTFGLHTWSAWRPQPIPVRHHVWVGRWLGLPPEVESWRQRVCTHCPQRQHRQAA